MKNYNNWTPVKAKINNNHAHPVGYKEREIWWCSFGENIGFEEDGKGDKFVRPALIVKIFSRYLCHVIPLSTTAKRNKYYFPFNFISGKNSVALLSQSRSIDSARLHYKIGIMDNDEFIKIKTRLRRILNL